MAVKKESLKQFLNYHNLFFGLSLLLCLFIGKFPSLETAFSLILCAILLLSFKGDEFFLYTAIFVFFVDQFNINLANPVYRIYSYLVVIKLMFQIFKIEFKAYWFPSLIVFATFSIFAVGLKLSPRNGFNLLADILIGYFVVIKLYTNPKLLRKFLILFVFTAICAGIYSILAGNKQVYDIGRMNVRSKEIVRYCATFGDANYAGLFYNIAIYIALCLKNFKLPLRIPVLLILHYFLFLTNSVTGFMCYLVCMTAYIILRYRKKSIFVFCAVLFTGIIIISIILAVPTLNKIDFIRNIIIRLSEQIRYLKSGRMDMFTSDRTYIWDYFSSYFKNQGIIGKLFGGNVVTSMFTEKVFEKYKACHLAYLQGLLNFGIVGALIIFLSFFARYIKRIFSYLVNIYKTQDGDIYCALAIISTAWIFFAFSIDYFLDWRFMLFYFM